MFCFVFVHLYLFFVFYFYVQMSPTKHSAPKKPSSKHARTDSENFKFVEADLKYNDCYKRAMIIMEMALKDTCILAVFR